MIRSTINPEPLNALRKELNSERAYVRQVLIREARGASKQTTIFKAQIFKHNAVILKIAIKKIKKIRPRYRFLKPERI